MQETIMSEPTAANETILRFGYPATLVAELEHWVVLLRRHQATLGALILACRDDVTAFAEISPGAFAELGTATRLIEDLLGRTFAYDKINYLMLMMVDPHVHFHVIPRYGRSVDFEGVTFEDPGWPKVPDLGSGPTLDDAMAEKLLKRLRAELPR
jgi:diadenosine tetraphosphate (Ap4A) HIT family hydrolase